MQLLVPHMPPSKPERGSLTKRNNVDNQHPVLQRHKLEVCELHNRPNHPILLQRIEIRALQLLLRIRPLHNRHTAQKHEQIAARKHDLIRSHSGHNLQVGTTRDAHFLLQEAEPFCGRGTEDAAAVEGHAGCAAEFVVGEAFALHKVLGHGVAGCEEDGCCDGLGEEGARGQFGLVPGGSIIVNCVLLP